MALDTCAPVSAPPLTSRVASGTRRGATHVQYYRNGCAQYRELPGAIGGSPPARCSHELRGHPASRCHGSTLTPCSGPSKPMQTYVAMATQTPFCGLAFFPHPTSHTPLHPPHPPTPPHPLPPPPHLSPPHRPHPTVCHHVPPLQHLRYGHRDASQRHRNGIGTNRIHQSDPHTQSTHPIRTPNPHTQSNPTSLDGCSRRSKVRRRVVGLGLHVAASGGIGSTCAGWWWDWVYMWRLVVGLGLHVLAGGGIGSTCGGWWWWEQNRCGAWWG